MITAHKLLTAGFDVDDIKNLTQGEGEATSDVATAAAEELEGVEAEVVPIATPSVFLRF